jgi:hypothetical protein
MAIDRHALRQTIEKSRADRVAAVVSTNWLKQVERELAELDRLRVARARA